MVNHGMQLLDWCIVAGLWAGLIAVLIYCQRYIKNSADFLAAGRCAGRYMLSISQGIAGFAVVNSVATFEMFYQAGFSSTWWAMLSAPLGLVLALVAWVTYRLRETRCFTLAQFFEVRYSRRFRVGAGILTWFSGIVIRVFFLQCLYVFSCFSAVCRNITLSWESTGMFMPFF